MSKTTKPFKYPSTICMDCGTTYGRRKVGIATWSPGQCGICMQFRIVTEPRDFGHLQMEKVEYDFAGGKIQQGVLK